VAPKAWKHGARSRRLLAKRVSHGGAGHKSAKARAKRPSAKSCASAVRASVWQFHRANSEAQTNRRRKALFELALVDNEIGAK